MFDCHQTTALASDWLEGRLSWWGRVRYGMHLIICNRCRRFLRQLRATMYLLVGLEPLGPDQRDREALLAQFRARRLT